MAKKQDQGQDDTETIGRTTEDVTNAATDDLDEDDDFDDEDDEDEDEAEDAE